MKKHTLTAPVCDGRLSRRDMLRLGLSGMVLASAPWAASRTVWADEANPHLLVTIYADGGWDVTQVYDAHDPNDMTDGVDVDVPQAISGLPPSQITTVGAVTYMGNPTTRPAVDTFFNNFAGRTALINGINVRSTSHEQGPQLMLTGYLDPTKSDFAVIAAHKNGVDLPLPHLSLSGPTFGGQFSGLSGRVGGQMSQAIAYNRIPAPNNQSLAVSSIGEAYVQQALQWESMLQAQAPAGALTDRLGQFYDSQSRGEKLARLATALPQNNGNGAQLATSIGQAFRQGLTTSVTVNQGGGFDTHNDNTQQNNSWMGVFTFLNAFCTGLAGQPGIRASSLLDETTIIYFSEFGRTPQLNDQNGKDHHPWNSMLVMGKGVAPGVYGQTDGNQKGVKVNMSTGRPDDTGQVLDVTNLVAGIITLAGANPSSYLPNGITPFTAMVA